MAYLQETPFTIIDVQTLPDPKTGGQSGDVVAIACVKMRGPEILNRFFALIDPDSTIPEEFTRKTGLYPADFSDAALLDDILPAISAFIDRDVIVWSHAPEKSNKVFRFFKLTQPKDKMLFIPSLGKVVLPDLKRYGLSDLSARLQRESHNLNRANGRAECAAELMAALLAELQGQGIRTMPQLLAACPKTRSVTVRRTRKDLPFDRDRLRHYPQTPGVYFMKNRLGEILYIGKAKNLRSRLRSYFQKQSRLAPKIAAMMKQVAMIDVQTVGSELEALLLEARLIKEYQPFFNKKVKDFKRMVFMRISIRESYPRISVAVDTDDPDSMYFGPFMGKVGLEYSLDALNRVFRLRSCSDSEFAAHRDNPCMQYQLNLCSGPCAGLIDSQDYRESVEDFIRYIQQETCHTLDRLLMKRNAYADALQFEKAAAVQNQLDLLEALQLRSGNVIQAVEEHNCIVILPGVQPGSFRLLSVLQGQPFEWTDYHPATDSERILEKVIQTLALPTESEAGTASTVPKALYEEARLLAQWLSNEDCVAVYLNGKSPRRILRELKACLAAEGVCDQPQDQAVY